MSEGAGTAWFDSHCHLGADAAAVVSAARAGGVASMVNVGTDLAGSSAAIDTAGSIVDVWATVGVHPHDTDRGCDGIVDLLGDPTVVAVGECGLDFHYDHSDRAAQREVFATQIAIARDAGLPVVVHTRSAWDETFDVLAAEPLPEGSVFHCFTGGVEELHRCLDVGAFVSFSGIVTFKSADDVRAAARACPRDRMLVETDAPYLAPVPHRGRPNEPALVAVVGTYIASMLEVPWQELASLTCSNATRAFRLDCRIHPAA